MRLTRIASVLALLGPLGAHAAYSNLAVPAGWGGSAASGWTMNAKVAANAGNWVTSGNLTSTIANVGGRAVTVPAQMRFAANAGQIAMNALRLNPATMAASVAASFMLTYGLTYAVDHWVKDDTQTVDGWAYGYQPGSFGYSTATAAAAAKIAAFPTSSGTTNYTYSAPTCTPFAGGNVTTSCTYMVMTNQCVSGCYPGGSNTRGTFGPDTYSFTLYRNWQSVSQVVQRPAVDGDFVVPPGDPIPAGLPEVVPAPLPVELPRINPNPSPNGDPAPLRVPLGDPEPIPNTNPTEWRKPYQDIVPSPTQSEPWRVDLRPGELREPNPTPIADPQVAPAPQTAPQEQKPTCGLPDTPPCKIDETGTPSPPASDHAAKVGQLMGPVDALINSPVSGLPALPNINWSFTMPTGCSVISLGSTFARWGVQGVDICAYQGMIHDLLAMFWAGTGLWAAVGIMFKGSA